jgi:acid phosphatase type 7
MSRRLLLAIGLAALVAVPARADKTIALTVGPWRFLATAAPPPAWTDPGFDDRGWGGPAPGPFAPLPPGYVPPSGAEPGTSPAPPVTFYSGPPRAPLFLRARFSLADAGHARVLDLRVGYRDGFIAYVNGREVARRGVGPNGADPVFPHGPEAERISIPISSAQLPALRPDGNLLAVAIYAWPGRSPIAASAPAVAIDVSAASGVRFLRGPYLSRPTEALDGNTVRLSWQTDLPASATISLERVDAHAPARRPALERAEAWPVRVIKIDASAGTHTATLGGLAPDAAYRYEIDADAGSGDVARAGPNVFKTVAAASQPFRFAVYGDMRYPGHAAHRAVVEALVREAPPLVFNTGDLTDVGSEESNWQKYFELTAPMGAIAPVVPALGNHDADRRGLGAPIAWSLFGVPAKGPPGWTSLDLGGVHFVILSTNEMRNPAQRDWLREDLARARRHHARAIFAFCHEGPWSHALHAGESIMVHDYAPILAAAHVDVLFSGHDHVYERGVGTTPAGTLDYVVSGGGGAPLYNPTCQAASGPPPVGVPAPLPPCPSSVAVLTNTYHYVMVEVGADAVTLCPKRPDGSAVEPCVRLPLRQPRAGH